jgi:hypothetical protein
MRTSGSEVRLPDGGPTTRKTYNANGVKPFFELILANHLTFRRQQRQGE